MVHRRLGRTDLSVSPLGFGAFKIGRNQGAKYRTFYDLPDDDAVDRLLNGVLDAGINLIDTAPAYGISEQRIGKAIAHRRGEYVLCTKAGETFENGRSRFDFTNSAIRRSVQSSLKNLATDAIDVLLIHSNGDDMAILNETDAVEALHELRQAGLVSAIGFSGKTIAGARSALSWADVLMVEYNLDQQEHGQVVAEAAAIDVGVLVKKGLASGTLDPTEAIEFVLSNEQISSLIVGNLSLEHINKNIEIANRVAV